MREPRNQHVRRSQFQSDAACRLDHVGLRNLELAVRCILVGLEIRLCVDRADAPARFGDAPHRPRQSVSMTRNRNRLCRVGSGIHDEISDFGISDCEQSPRDRRANSLALARWSLAKVVASESRRVRFIGRECRVITMPLFPSPPFPSPPSPSPHHGRKHNLRP